MIGKGETSLIHMTLVDILSFDVKVTPRDDAFDPGFDLGFEEDHTMFISNAGDDDYLALDGAPLATQTQTPLIQQRELEYLL